MAHDGFSNGSSNDDGQLSPVVLEQVQREGPTRSSEVVRPWGRFTGTSRDAKGLPERARDARSQEASRIE